MPGSWTFLTNHGHVLVAVAADPDARLREIAATVGITERAAQLIVRDLESAGYLSKTRIGRRNRYLLHPGGAFRHPAEAGQSVDRLLEIFVPLTDARTDEAVAGSGGPVAEGRPGRELTGDSAQPGATAETDPTGATPITAGDSGPSGDPQGEHGTTDESSEDGDPVAPRAQRLG